MSDHRADILTDERAADLLGTTPRKVRAWARRGILPGRQLPDGSFVFTTAELLRWLEQTPQPGRGEVAARG